MFHSYWSSVNRVHSLSFVSQTHFTVGSRERISIIQIILMTRAWSLALTGSCTHTDQVYQSTSKQEGVFKFKTESPNLQEIQWLKILYFLSDLQDNWTQLTQSYKKITTTKYQYFVLEIAYIQYYIRNLYYYT